MKKKYIKGYEGLYCVTTNGLIWSCKRKVKNPRNKKTYTVSGKFLRIVSCGRYGMVDLCKNGTRKKFLVHRLVADAFVKNPKLNPQVNHIDGNKRNNNYKNLEWVTAKENSQHSIITGLKPPAAKGEFVFSSILKSEDIRIIRKLISDGVAQKDVAKMFGVNKSTIYDIRKKRTWRHVL